jgi:hypothetical protein
MNAGNPADKTTRKMNDRASDLDSVHPRSQPSPGQLYKEPTPTGISAAKPARNFPNSSTGDQMSGEYLKLRLQQDTMKMEEEVHHFKRVIGEIRKPNPNPLFEEYQSLLLLLERHNKKIVEKHRQKTQGKAFGSLGT